MGLTAKLEGEHFGELAYLRRMFLAQDTGNKGAIHATQVFACLQVSGIGAVVGDMLDKATHILEDKVEHVTFVEFLNIVTALREDERVWVKALFKRHFSAESEFVESAHSIRGSQEAGMVAANDIPALMVKIGVCVDCVCVSRLAGELARIMSFCDRDCPDQLDHTSAADLVLKIAQRARAAARHREHAIAVQVGLSSEQVLQLRMAFAALTRTGAIGVAEVRAFLTELNPDVTPLEYELVDLMKRVCPPPPISAYGNSADADVDDSTFSDESTDEEEEIHEEAQDAPPVFRPQRQVATVSVGEFPTDTLRFDGFMRLVALLMAGS
jgi:hypothetical protein